MLKQNYRPTIHIGFTLLILFFTLYMTHHFIIPMAWSAVFVIACWPAYQKVASYFPKHSIWAASIMTFVILVAIILPLIWLLWEASKDALLVVNYLLEANKAGEPAPPWLDTVPLVGRHLNSAWLRILAKPHGLNEFLAGSHFSIAPLSKYARTIGLKAAHGFTLVFFAILTMFFFFKDGKRICRWLQEVGHFCMEERWSLYVNSIPGAIRATVIGSVLVGFGVGITMGLAYLLFGVTAPVLLGLITGVLAMIPFGAPLAFILVGLIHYFKGHLVGAVAIVLIGFIVMFVADHFVRPKLIGGATRLPFLAVLLGIIGGIETMGLIGLFLGPTVMVLLLTLCREPSLRHHGDW